jgi:microcystin-dependent protein
MPFANNAVPTGWLAANGSAVSRTTYAALFAAIGTTYGAGDGSTTFALPDLRGTFVRGFDGTRGLDSGRTFGSYQGDGVISHTHSGTTGGESQNHTHGYSHLDKSAPSGIAQGSNFKYFDKTTTMNSVNHSHSFDTSSQTPAGATETRPKNIAMLYCIKF